jgi:hypothetical protein
MGNPWCIYPSCNRPHDYVEGYPHGCPYEGRPSSRVRPVKLSVEEQITAAETHRQVTHDHWHTGVELTRADEAAQRAVEYGKLKAETAAIYAAYHATVAAEVEAGRAVVDAQRQGIRAVEHFRHRDRLRARDR